MTKDLLRWCKWNSHVLKEKKATKSDKKEEKDKKQNKKSLAGEQSKNGNTL